MQIKQLVGNWAKKIAAFLPLFLSGCATLSKSQENFAKQMRGSEGPAAQAMSAIPLHAIMFHAVWIIGMAVSAIAGHFVVHPYVKSVKKYLNVKGKESSLSVVAGSVERIIYTITFVLGWYSIIVILFVLKVGQLVVRCLDVDTKKAGNVANAYLLGNLLSLGSAVLVGLIVKKLLFII